MKSLLVGLAIIFCLLMSNIANAQCAWVLWEQSEFGSSSDKTKDYFRNWTIVGAFPTSSVCLQTEEDLCKRREKLLKEHSSNCSCFKSWGGHTLTRTTEDGFLVLEFKCLPDTIDPRK